MSGSSSDEDKQHEPSQKKLDEARKKGDLARSADLNTAAGYAGLVLCAAALGPFSVQTLADVFIVLLSQADRLATAFTSDGQASLSLDLVITVLKGAGAWFAIPAGLVTASILVQRSLVFSPEKLSPKVSRISPIENAKNKFGINGIFEFSKSMAKLLIFTIVLVLYLQKRRFEISDTLYLDPAVAARTMGQLCVEFLAIAAVIALAIGLVDYFWQFTQHRKRNRMSHTELKDEIKQSEGDPHTKQQRRQKGMQIALGQMLSDVQQADVVIVNPTHYAVALKWEPISGGAPVCVAKGVDEVARRIREIAAEAGVPMHRDPPTARALHAATEVGQEVLPEHYKPVAAAIRFAEAMRRKGTA